MGAPGASDSEPVDQEPDEVEQYRMPLLDHLRELRNRLMISAGAVMVGMIVSMAFVNEIIDIATAPMKQAMLDHKIEGGLAIVGSPFEGPMVWMNASFLGAVTLASPVIAYNLWAFVAPGLYQTERKWVLPLSLTSTGLFMGGASFCYFVIFPVAFPFFFTIVEAEVSLSIQGYLSAVLRMLVAFGLAFQMPVLTFFAARTGLVDHRDLISGFRYAMVGIFVVAAIITPPDVVSQTLLALPLTGLYGVSIGVAWAFSTKVRV